MALMHIDDCYRLLELDPGASLEDVRRAHLDLAKVWHPDRFEHDARLRQKAEEKLKLINEAYATIRDSSGRDPRGTRPGSAGDGCRVRVRGRELRFEDLSTLAGLVDRGVLRGDAELFDPAVNAWVPLSMIPSMRGPLARARFRKNRGWAISFAAMGVFVLLRRPTPGGLLIAIVMLGVAAYFFYRMRPDA